MKDSILSLLDIEDTSGYGRLPIPSSIDTEVECVVRFFMDQSPDTKRRLLDAVIIEQQPILRAYSERMASLAVRRSDPSYIILGLVALTLACTDDLREALLILPLHYRSAVKMHLDPAVVFQQAASFTAPEGREMLISFLTGRPESQQVEVMGYEESRDQDGFRYQRTW
jgi:hypothetical protein